jgi:glycosyltransferase involved in cell wall biosynthesis
VNSPRVSIGLPVHNGENYLEEAIKSILSQTFEEFELIISDNASTDKTKEICNDYASQDKRVTYSRNPENLGASANYIRVFNLGSAEYFKWAAHDDLCKEDYLKKCIEVLDNDPSIVLCFSRVSSIDPNGKIVKEWDPRPNLDSQIAHERFRDVLERTDTFPIWGVIRADTLRRTPLLGNYPAHDRPLLAELSLYGRFHEVPEFLFLDREHPQRSVRAYDASKPRQAITWYDPKQADKLIFPAWKLLAEYGAAINRAPIHLRERLRCYFEILRWIKYMRLYLFDDLIFGGGHLPLLGSLIKKLNEIQSNILWSRKISNAEKDLKSVVSTSNPIIMVDQGEIDPGAFLGWRKIPFPESDGEYWGLPASDSDAIQELERLRSNGFRYIVFAWPAYWWFHHYTVFYQYLRSKYKCIFQNNRILVFDLN